MTKEDLVRQVRALIGGHPAPDDGSACALDAAAIAAVVVRTAEVALVEAVTTARRRGHSWADVGVALGVSRQAAWERFGETATGGRRSGRFRPADVRTDDADRCPRCGELEADRAGAIP